MKITTQIIEARKAAGMSQTELAEKLGTSQGVVSQIEKARRSPNIEQLSLMAELFGIEFSITAETRREFLPVHNTMAHAKAKAMKVLGEQATSWTTEDGNMYTLASESGRRYICRIDRRIDRPID